MIGLGLSFIIGTFIGAVMVPTKYVPKDIEGVPYIVSFGIGVAVVMPIFAILYFGLIKRQIPDIHFKVSFFIFLLLYWWDY